MTSSELARLRSTLQDLQSVELPANYQQLFIDKENDPNHRNDAATDAANTDASTNNVNHELLHRYKTARNAYLQQKTIGCFLSSLQKYDPTTNKFPLPQSIDPTEQVELSQRQATVLEAIQETMDKVSGEMDIVQMTWKKFVEKRMELTQIVEGIERDERNRQLSQGEEENDGMGPHTDATMDDDEDEEEITEDDVALQEEKLEALQQRKLDLEKRLRHVRSQILDMEDDCHRTKRIVNEVREKSGRKPLVWKTGDSEATTTAGDDNDTEEKNGEHIPAVTEQLELEIAQMEHKATELKKSSDFYDGMRELMEELGGVKILSSTTIPSSTSVGEPTPNNNNKGFILTLMLLGSHILEITLLQTLSTQKDGLHISNAKITTATTFPMPESPKNNMGSTNDEETTSLMETMHSISLSNQSFSKILSQKQAVEVTIPPLDDLVSWSHSLESSSHGIRFILLETMARIRTLEARVVELSTLRERYAAHVYDVDSSSTLMNHRYGGGAEQEVVCAINEGITVALRLGSDCPLVPGSVYISEIFGLGGWDDEKLKTLKGVVLNSRCRGPVEVMQCLTTEIRKRCREEGWVVPTTPTLPRGKRSVNQ
ncbi:hypothetical protein ACHAWU_004604 [Discostella pseudostelligera]|uniref:Uncharacterized protein n=1 Tax=Discostella pseudostelligera TaxID=259834 RepID=A0ABD3M0Q1_9STRA